MAFNSAIPRLSLRWQITLLGALAVVLLLAVLVAMLAALRFTKPAVLNEEKRQLADTTRELAHEYSKKSQSTGQNSESSPLQNPTLESSRDILTLLARVALRNADGVEGGFYANSVDALVGIAYPTVPQWAEETGNTGMLLETGTPILRIARMAARSHSPAEQVLISGNDYVIMEAVPIQDGQRFVGSAWTVKKLSGLPGANRFRAYLATAGLGAAALACVVLTLFVVRNLRTGVQKVESGLENLEQNLGAKIAVDSDPDEIQQIARAINRLGATLNQKIEHEKQIEDQLRHSERLAALGRLIAGVAHEIRNPLATIRLRVQMCQQEAASPTVQESCEIALEEIERLNGMVSRLLSFSQPVQLHSELTDITQLIHQRLASMQEKARQHCVKILTNLPEKFEPLPLDQSRMAQVFDNLIQNAIEAMDGRGGNLCVNVTSRTATAQGAREICVEFNDTGKGIAPNMVKRIFDPFFTTKPSGTGLGLSICHELVHAHGGEIHVRSAQGRGTTVQVVLPVRNGNLSSQSV